MAIDMDYYNNYKMFDSSGQLSNPYIAEGWGTEQFINNINNNKSKLKSFNELNDEQKSNFLLNADYKQIGDIIGAGGQLPNEWIQPYSESILNSWKSSLPINYTSQPSTATSYSANLTNYDKSMADEFEQSLPNYNVFAKLSPTEQKDILINNPNILTPQGSQIYDAKTNTIKLQESNFTKNQRLDQERLAMQLSRALSGNLPSTDNEAVRNATFQLGKQQLDPEMKRQREALAIQLANQGIPINSEAYNSAMNRLEQQQGSQLNQLSLQSQIAGIQTAEAQRAARFNEISSLLGRSQVGTGASFGQMQSGYQGLDIMGAEQAALNRQSQEAIGRRNNQAMQNAAMWQAAGSAIGGIAGGIGSFFSDIALKTNIQFENKIKNNLPIYTFEYINKNHGVGRFEGVMAQDVEKTYPQAVSISPEGYKMVDYSQIGIEFRRV